MARSSIFTSLKPARAAAFGDTDTGDRRRGRRRRTRRNRTRTRSRTS